jgi:hypothetical protein
MKGGTEQETILDTLGAETPRFVIVLDATIVAVLVFGLVWGREGGEE